MTNGSAFIDPDKISQELSQRGMAWADAEAAAMALEETKKPLLAKLATESGGRSEAERERLAMADPQFTDHVQKMVKARSAAIKAKVRHETYKAYLELLRTAAASERAAMTLR